MADPRELLRQVNIRVTVFVGGQAMVSHVVRSEWLPPEEAE